jgi:hypothetical protein
VKQLNEINSLLESEQKKLKDTQQQLETLQQQQQQQQQQALSSSHSFHSSHFKTSSTQTSSPLFEWNLLNSNNILISPFQFHSRISFQEVHSSHSFIHWLIDSHSHSHSLSLITHFTLFCRVINGWRTVRNYNYL